MSVTREELGLAIAKAFTNESPSGGYSLEFGHIFNTTYSHDIRKVADKLMPLLAKVWEEGADAKHREWTLAAVQASQQDWSPIPTPVNPYEKVNDV